MKKLPRRKVLKTKSSKKPVKAQNTNLFSLDSAGLVSRIQKELESNQSYLSLVLGVLIVLVVGILVFNYFKKGQDNLLPAQQTQNEPADVTPDNLPGKYTVKEGDTLFTIAQKYYNDGYQYPKLAEANNLANPDAVDVGQVLEIPKVEVSPSPTPSPAENQNQQGLGIGGATNQTEWGEKIDGDTYTVQLGDWLSKIAGRAYGDIYAFDKIVQANNIQNPNEIEVGTVLKIPR
ncbi:LysM peptidoglycan-binding domain-containing protein [Candidatus Daviesbacteria bacterium]|nr:LysM peptidoglycan-binding domain-containing protein [Candidatus Daviesbacteria bacterium]